MHKWAEAITAIALFVGLLPASGSAMTAYSQDFEGLDQTDPAALAGDGWWVYGNVFTPEGDYLYGYGPFPAPNHEIAFCAIALGEGGAEQGEQQLVVFSDYENGDHGAGNLIESNVFQEQTIGADDTGKAWVFEFQAKIGNLEGSSTAAAFIKTLDPASGYALTNFITVDMTDIPDTWGGYGLYLNVGPELEGQIFQFGFMNVATNYEGSGVFYDNLVFYATDPIDVPETPQAAGATLGQNHPNPFNPATRIGFALERAGRVRISIHDLEGRRIATLLEADLGAGEHEVTWNGMREDGAPAASGRYWYVLETPRGRLSRGMTLVK